MNKGFASADEYQTLKLASRLISILDMESTIRASVAQTAGGLATQMSEDEKFRSAFSELLINETDIAQALSTLAEIYAEHYTVKELRAQIDFHRSDVGQSLLSKKSTVMPLFG